jgi:hypothetical protein
MDQGGGREPYTVRGDKFQFFDFHPVGEMNGNHFAGNVNHDSI